MTPESTATNHDRPSFAGVHAQRSPRCCLRRASCPLVGIFLVQRRLSLVGDGMGHVALAGVAVGVLTDQSRCTRR
ncbi:metal ABC transporter permease [Ornithinimicrobium sp. INDO-MA30-4]|uniref:metal ABC transporter permease n=1 Tax=Ornithinimicrobium sp. INDO-MA30-4 TaxID=2908651 RepID=UPI0037C908DE